MTGVKSMHSGNVADHSISGFLDEAPKILLQFSAGTFHQFHKNLNHWYDIYTEQNNKAGFIHFCRNHESIRFFHEEPITHRSYYKPRGYAGDAELIDFLYRLKSPSPKTTYWGRELFANILESNICQSVRWRALHLAEKIDEVHQSNQKRINILSLASGHLRELHYVLDFDRKVERFYGIDQDPRSNEEARRSLPYLQLDIREESILNVIREKYKPNRPLDFIYSAGLFDYLNDKVAQKLITSSFRLLAPGGRILVANFAPGITEQAYMEAFMDWHLIYRDENQMEALVEDLPLSQVGEVKTYRDPMGNVVYLQIIKN